MSDDYQIPPPEWFNLDKYENSYTLDLHQWFWNIFERINALNILEKKSHIYGEAENYVQELSIYYIKEIEKFRNQGFIIYDDVKEQKNELENNPLTQTLNISDIQSSLLLMNEKNMDNKERALRALNDPCLKDYEASEIPLNFINEDYSFCYASININAPLDMIEKDFKKWVVEQKEIHNLQLKRVIESGNKDIKRWRDYKILPYLDILIWKQQRQNNNRSYREYTDPIISEWLFKNGFIKTKGAKPIDSHDVLKETVKKIIKEIRHYKYIDYLETQLNHKPNK